ncbi:hypothetical protein VUR80DRAFT_316 [Thermomyces stellatus]
MRSRIVTIIAAASVASAVTPEGFEPASDTELFVQYGNQVVTPGAVLPQNATQVQPTIGTAEQLPGTYAVVMVDLDIPADLQNGTAGQNGTDSPNQPNALLHWLQTDLPPPER